VNLRQKLLSLITQETELHKQYGNGRLIFKVNSLVDTELIDALYAASQAGVQIDLIVRGICCLRPKVVAVSDNIRVISIVGRFLEHSRIYYSRNNGDEQIFLASADLMPRNLDRRVESMFPVLEPALRDRVVNEVLLRQLQDNVKARELTEEGVYRYVSHDGVAPVINSQLELLSAS
jgi:polyphosphate kinase